MDIVQALFWLICSWFFQQLLLIMFALFSAFSDGLNQFIADPTQPTNAETPTNPSSPMKRPTNRPSTSSLKTTGSSTSGDDSDYYHVNKEVVESDKEVFREIGSFVKINSCEIGSTVPIPSLDASLFPVFVLSADINNPNHKVLVKQKIILAILPYQIAEVTPLPNRPKHGLVQNVYQLQALRKLRFRANPNPHSSSHSRDDTSASSITSSLLSIFSSTSSNTASFTTNTTTPTTTASTPATSPSSSPASTAPTTAAAVAHPLTTSSGLLVLELKSGKLLKYYCHDPLPCVEAIKKKMKELGMEGQHQKHSPDNNNSRNKPAAITTSSSSPFSSSSTEEVPGTRSAPSSSSSPSRSKTRRGGGVMREEEALEIAHYYLEQSKQIERDFSLNPSLRLIEEMMNLFRLAVEHFANVPNHYYHEKVIYTIQQFLIRDDVVQVLDQCSGKNKGKRQNQTSTTTATASLSSSHNNSSTRSAALQSPVTTSHDSKEVIRHLTEEVLLSPRQILVDDSEIERKYFFPPSLTFDDLLARSGSLDAKEDRHLSQPTTDRGGEVVVEETEGLVGGEEGEDLSLELDQLLMKIDAEFHSLLQSFEESSEGGEGGSSKEKSIQTSSKVLEEVEELVHEIQVKDLERALLEL